MKQLNQTAPFAWRISDSSPASRVGWISLTVVLGIALAGVVVFAFWYICWPLTGGKNVCRAIAQSPPWTLLTSLAAAPSLIAVWLWRTQAKDQELRNKGHDIAQAKREERSRRFFDAIRLLSDDKTEARLGAIYSLESLAVDAPEELPRVVATLCAFVRGFGDKESERRTKVDLQAAFEQAAKLSTLHDACHPLDFRNARLADIDAESMSLVRANFKGALLSRSSFRGANLSLADFRESQVRGTDFESAILTSADFTGAGYSSETRFPEGFLPKAAGMSPFKEQPKSPDADS